MALRVVPFILEANRNTVIRVSPKLFHQTVIKFSRPFAAQELFDGFASLKKFAAVVPPGIRGVCERDSFRVAGVPGIFGGSNLRQRSLLIFKKPGGPPRN